MNVKVKRKLLGVAVFLLLALTWLGVKGGIEQWPQSSSLGQMVQSTAQFTYGILSLLAVASAAQTGTFARVVRIVWLAALTTAGGLAPVVWGGAVLGAGLVAGIASFAVGLLVLWLLSLGTRGLTSA